MRRDEFGRQATLRQFGLEERKLELNKAKFFADQTTSDFIINQETGFGHLVITRSSATSGTGMTEVWVGPDIPVQQGRLQIQTMVNARTKQRERVMFTTGPGDAINVIRRDPAGITPDQLSIVDDLWRGVMAKAAARGHAAIDDTGNFNFTAAFQEAGIKQFQEDWEEALITAASRGLDRDLVIMEVSLPFGEVDKLGVNELEEFIKKLDEAVNLTLGTTTSRGSNVDPTLDVVDGLITEREEQNQR